MEYRFVFKVWEVGFFMSFEDQGYRVERGKFGTIIFRKEGPGSIWVMHGFPSVSVRTLRRTDEKVWDGYWGDLSKEKEAEYIDNYDFPGVREKEFFWSPGNRSVDDDKVLQVSKEMGQVMLSYSEKAKLYNEGNSDPERYSRDNSFLLNILKE